MLDPSNYCKPCDYAKKASKTKKKTVKVTSLLDWFVHECGMQPTHLFQAFGSRSDRQGGGYGCALPRMTSFWHFPCWHRALGEDGHNNGLVLRPQTVCVTPSGAHWLFYVLHAPLMFVFTQYHTSHGDSLANMHIELRLRWTCTSWPWNLILLPS